MRWTGFVAAIALPLVGAIVPIAAAADAMRLTLREYVGQTWADELIHYPVSAPAGAFPGGTLKVLETGGQEVPAQLSDVVLHDDGSLKSANVWLVVTLRPGETKTWTLAAGAPQAKSDLAVKRAGDTLEVTTARTGARFRLGEATYDPPVPAKEVPGYLAAIRQRSGVWGGRSWIETPHACRSRKVWVIEQGPVYVKVGFAYRFDGYRGEGADVYQGHVRIAARQELIEFVEEFSLGDPAVYRLWKPRDRADELMWDWWQWRPHDAESYFGFSLYDGLKPTRARWFGHNATVPEKRTGPAFMQLDFETDYPLTYRESRFEVDVSSYHNNCPDRALSYLAWRAGDPASDAVGVIGLRAAAWVNPDMVPRLSAAIKQHTDTAALRICTEAKPDLVVRAPLHLGKRVWGLITLQMPEAGITEDEVKDGQIVKHSFQRGSSQALRLRNKYSCVPLDKAKAWTLEWPAKRTYPSLFIREGGLPAVLARVRSSQALQERARSQQYKPINRYLLHGTARHAQDAYNELLAKLDGFINGAFVWGYNAHNVGLNINQFPWWMQEYSAQFDLVMGMPEIGEADKETLKARFAFCANMLHDPDFWPPRATGVGWGSANMPVNMRGAQAVTACALADNPDAAPWLALAIEVVDVLVPHVWAEDGSSVSGPHYTSTQADPLMNMVLPLYCAGALPPIQQKYPRLASFTRLLIDRMTPPEPRARHTRVLPTIGHTCIEYDSNIGKYALLMNLTDRKLAGEAYWMWKRAGGALDGFMDGIYYFSEDFDEHQPDCRSVVYPGSTTILRNGFPRENETYMAIHVGNHSVDHYDRDVGAFLLYAKGVPLMMDFASMYQPNCWQSLWHNTLSWNVEERPRKTPCPGRDSDCFYTVNQLPWIDHTYEPHTLLDREADSQTRAADGYKELGGEMRAQAFSAEADYAMAAVPLTEFMEWPWLDVAESPNPQVWGSFSEFRRRRLARPCQWQRRFLFVKDEDLNGPNYFLIHDDLDGQDELAPQANFWCLADAQQIDGDLVRWTGQYNIDLDLYVAWPKRPKIGTREWWHTNRGPANADFKGGREFQIAAHIAQQPGKGGFSVVLYPRGRYEVTPAYASNADGTAVQLRIGERTDTLFCARTTGMRKLGKVSCEGTVAVVKEAAGYTAVALCEPGTVRTPELEVAAAAPLALRLTGHTLTGTVGPGELRLRLPTAFAGRTVTVGGKPGGTVGLDGTLRLVVEAGGALTVADKR